MSDRPPKKSDAPSSGSGWQQPKTTGQWRVPEKPAEKSGWQVPALPTDLDEEPTSTGGWHLPKPEQTPFTPESVLGTDGEATTQAATSQPAPKTSSSARSGGVPLTAAPSLSPEDELLAIVTNATQEAALERAAGMPKSSTPAPQAPEDLISMLDKIEDDDQDDTLSMSELVALASLVEDEPKVEVIPAASSPMIAPVVPPPNVEQTAARTPAVQSPAERAAAALTDPGDYARQQLASLGGTQTASASPAITPSGTVSDVTQTDAAEYARRQLAELGIDDGTGALAPTAGMPIPAAPAQTVDPRLEELARRFRETEDEVRILRGMLQAGQINQQQFEDQLRNLMILDDDQVWWVMGAETDTWYKSVNNEWVLATPPRVPVGMGSQAGFGVYGDVIQDSLPRIDSQPQAAMATAAAVPTGYGTLSGSGAMGGAAAGMEESYPLPIPKAGVPTVDPDRTVVGASYLDPVLKSSAETIPNMGYGASQPTVAGSTVPSAAVSAGYGVGSVGYGQANQAPYGQAAQPSIVGDDGEISDELAVEGAPDVPTFEEAARNQRSRMVLNGVLVLVGLGAVAAVIGIVAVVVILNNFNAVISQYEQPIVALASYRPEFQTVTIQDREGNTIAQLSQGGQERINVKLDQISPFLIHAIISTQNPTFYQDPGWDAQTVIFNSLGFGAERDPNARLTITEQVTRELVLRGATISANDAAFVAGELTRRYDKNFILELYLNEFSFGNQVYGVEAAAQFYFGKSARDLNIAEAALLAAVLESPINYDPVTSRDTAARRMDEILQVMATVGCLRFQHGQWVGNPQGFCVTRQGNPNDRVNDPGVDSGTTARFRSETRLRRFRPRESQAEYPHFVALVQQQLEATFGATVLYSSGFTVKTTLVPALQDYAQDRLDEKLRELGPTGLTTGSILVTDPNTGAVWVYIGSRDFFDAANNGQTDFARAYRQPGSIIKPFVYATALQGADRNGNGIIEFGEYLTPASILWDVPTTYNTTPPFTPANFASGVFYGAVPMRAALQGDYNVSAVKAFEFVGSERFREVTEDMGLEWEDETVFSVATGMGVPQAGASFTDVTLYDLVTGYGTIANGGKRVPLYTVNEIRDRDGNLVQLPETLRPPATPVLDPENAYLLQDMLSDDEAREASRGFPPNSALTLGGNPRRGFVGAKTGSTTGNDMWTIGFVSNAVVGVWLGRADQQPVTGTNSFTAAAPLWNRVITQVIDSNPAKPTGFTQPSNMVTLSICPDTGAVAGQNCASPTRNQLFAPNRRPPNADQSFLTSATINTWTQLLANDFCNQAEDRVTQQFVNIPDLAAVNWLNSSAGQPTARRLGLPIPLVAAPTVGCDVNLQYPTANIVSPSGNQTLVGSVQVFGQVAAPNDQFDRFQVEYAPINTSNFRIIGGFSTVQQPNPNTPLVTWDTTTVPNGQYMLRLVVIARNGGYIYRAGGPVIIDNIPPTPTITPFPTATITPAETLPPLPFDNPTPSS